MRLNLLEIKKVENYITLLHFLLLSWDIEPSDIQDPEYFSIGHEEISYIYMIQMDIYWVSKSLPIQLFCLTTLPINQELFFSKYNICSPDNFYFLQFDMKIGLLLGFAQIFYNFKSDFELGYNIIWAKKAFLTKIKNILNNVLLRCSLEGKIDLPHIPSNSSNLKLMFIYVNAIKFKDNQSKLEDFTT
ncbi:1889_t:CDS:2 [Dentiscutata heterogama]|uniref:1889_t:CDS:1 n=1 Tax=Dentiscutata heterogama TaxID=1316150 RepID=A0ACA9MTK2_9GLOM|nr:1889_t:CDS:2 [Dentiscutata heterogama]